jgi:uncharacterized protein YkwD
MRATLVASLGVVALAAVAAPQSPNLEVVEELVVADTNQFRASEGLATVQPNTRLEAAARAFAEYLANGGAFAHESGGSTTETRVRARGYDFCVVTENLARHYSSAGFTTKELAQRLVQGWKDSPGHRHNMLEPDASDTAIAVVHRTHNGVEDFYAVQLFGRLESESVVFKVRNRGAAQAAYRVNGKRFTLDPNWVRSHSRCASPRLEFDATTGSYSPRKGDCFVVTRVGEVRREPGGCE